MKYSPMEVDCKLLALFSSFLLMKTLWNIFLHFTYEYDHDSVSELRNKF